MRLIKFGELAQYKEKHNIYYAYSTKDANIACSRGPIPAKFEEPVII